MHTFAAAATIPGTIPGAVRAADPAAVALVAGGAAVTYGELCDRIDARHVELGLGARSLVLLGGGNDLEFVVTYLALLDGGHVPLLAGSHVERLAEAWRPDAVVHTTPAGIDVAQRIAGERVLHPDLALLLSTSGSTGSPKLVRLSQRNLTSNARAIGDYLGLSARDRAITSLPLHYCYGLSVLHSHLSVGASLVLTEASVVDPCFVAAMHEHGVTNVAGVPHTFELLEHAGPDRIHVPTLRFVTQAGGRLGADRAAQWLDRAEQWGIDFYVMYGQTEATARMAYLPPAVARRQPGAIGVAIRGGSLSLSPVEGGDDGVGELVYRGPNVMLGYATDATDLALGATLDELRTGDLARYHADDGVFEIVGRVSRFVKPFGVRIDLDVVERELARTITPVAVAGDDSHVAVVAPGAVAADVRSLVAQLTELPVACVAVDVDHAVPRTESGKVDDAAVLRVTSTSSTVPAPDDGSRAASVAAVYATVLGSGDVTPTSTFVSLGGDSLSYVECSIRLEHVLGHVPADWHLKTVDELDRCRPTARIPRLDTTVLLRAVGICLVVATHMRLWYFPGGAHIMLAVVGYNLSRFQLSIGDATRRVRAGLRTAARAAVPTVLWVAAGVLFAGAYGTGTLLLVNNYVGPPTHRDDYWHFWFVEVFVHLTVITTLLLAVPAVRRLERRFQYGVPLAVLVGCLALRLDWADMGDWYNMRFRTHGVAWCFALGWLIHRSTATWQRLITTVLCLAAPHGFFQTNPTREWFIGITLAALVWLPMVPFPRLAMRPVAVLASASMWILITHFTIWPPMYDALPIGWAYVATIAAGVLVWFVVEQSVRLGRRVELPRLRRARAQVRPSISCPSNRARSSSADLASQSAWNTL